VASVAVRGRAHHAASLIAAEPGIIVAIGHVSLQVANLFVVLPYWASKPASRRGWVRAGSARRLNLHDFDN
jgi:hypothetical protein